FSLQFLNKRGSGPGVLDEDAPRIPRFGEGLRLRLKSRIVDAGAPDVDEIPSFPTCHDPGRANRPIVLRPTFARRVPALLDKKALGCRRKFGISLDPMTLHHGAARWRGLLLILGRESVAPNLIFQGFQDLDGFAFRR